MEPEGRLRKNSTRELRILLPLILHPLPSFCLVCLLTLKSQVGATWPPDASWLPIIQLQALRRVYTAYCLKAKIPGHKLSLLSLVRGHCCQPSAMEQSSAMMRVGVLGGAKQPKQDGALGTTLEPLCAIPEAAGQGGRSLQGRFRCRWAPCPLHTHSALGASGLSCQHGAQAQPAHPSLF